MATEAPQAQNLQEEPSVGGMKVRPWVTLVLYVLLVSSAAFALWAQRNPAEVPTVLARAYRIGARDPWRLGAREPHDRPGRIQA